MQGGRGDFGGEGKGNMKVRLALVARRMTEEENIICPNTANNDEPENHRRDRTQNQGDAERKSRGQRAVRRRPVAVACGDSKWF